MKDVFSDEFDVDKETEYANYLLLLKQIINNPDTKGLIRDDLLSYEEKGKTEFRHKVVWWNTNGTGHPGSNPAA